MSSTLPFLTADDVAARLTPAGAVDALRSALLAGLDPTDDPARTILDVTSGQLMCMPSALRTAPGGVGVKLVTVGPGNAATGLPRVHGVYVLFDATTLAPVALLDGAAVTTLRTPAVPVAAVLPLLRSRRDPLRVVVFGAGPQGFGHAATLQDVLVRPPSITWVRSRADGSALAAGSAEVDDALREADVVVCATTARSPLFDSTVLPDRVVVMAVGSHEPVARELDGALLARAQVVVEDVATALREAGDVIMAIDEGHLVAGDLVPMAAMVRGDVTPATDRPIVVKTIGMAWQDLVVALAITQGT